MWWVVYASSVLAGAPEVDAAVVVLEVGVHASAGSPSRISADGAAGQCTLGAASLTCPADGPVRFAWRGDPRWELSGDVLLEPGQHGTALVLARDELSVDVLPTAVSVDAELVRAQFGATAAPLSRSMLDRLIELTEHDDPEVRVAALETLHPWCWRSSLGPLPSVSPLPIPPGFLLERSIDPSWKVRRTVAVIARDLRDERRSDEVTEVLLSLAEDPEPRVQKTALAALSHAARAGMVPGEQAWQQAMEGLPEAGARGRAAAGTLARLAPVLDPGPHVDPAAAVEGAMATHPELAWKIWAAWREDLPFRRDWAEFLLTRTQGIHKGLLVSWSEADPEQLADIISAWEPDGPHGERFLIVQTYLERARSPRLRQALDLPPLEAP